MAKTGRNNRVKRKRNVFVPRYLSALSNLSYMYIDYSYYLRSPNLFPHTLDDDVFFLSSLQNQCSPRGTIYNWSLDQLRTFH